MYKMVRFIVGAIVTYGMERGLGLESEWEGGEEHGGVGGGGEGDGAVGPRWHSRRRVCAPAHGLALDEVRYGRGWKFRWNGDGGHHDEEVEYRKRRSKL